MPPRLGRRRFGYAGTACPVCRIPLRHESLTTGIQACPACRESFEAIRFTPVDPQVVVPEIAAMGVDSAAPCSVHARNQAVAACEHCGKFMCELCKIAADGKVYCPSCFERLSSEGALASTVTRFKNYEGRALMCVLMTWLGGMFTLGIAGLVAAPLGIYYCFRGLAEKKRKGDREGRAALYLRLFLLLPYALVPVGLLLLLLKH